MRNDEIAKRLAAIGDLLDEAMRYEAELFDQDLPVDGADLVEWFAEWRKRVEAQRFGSK